MKVLEWKRLECLLQVGDDILHKINEFKYLGVLFTCERGRMEARNRRIGPASAVIQTLDWSVVVKKTPSRNAKLSIYQSICLPTHTYVNKLWVSARKNKIEAATGCLGFPLVRG